MNIYKVNGSSSIAPLVQKEKFFALKLCGIVTNAEVKQLIDASHGHCFALYLSEDMPTVPDDFLYGIHLPEYIVVPEGVVSLGRLGLLPSVHLRQLCLPSTLLSLNAASFPCNKIERIRFPNGTKYFKYDAGKLSYIEDTNELCHDRQYKESKAVTAVHSLKHEKFANTINHQQKNQLKKAKLNSMKKAAKRAMN